MCHSSVEVSWSFSLNSDRSCQTTSIPFKMSSEKPSPKNKATTRPKFPNLGMQEDMEAAQHSPLYPKLGRIGYVPDVELYEARLGASTKRLRESGVVGALPKGWPVVLRGPMAWSGSEMQKSNQWIYDLSSTDIAEILSGLEHCKGEQISKFPLVGTLFLLEKVSS